MLISPQEHDHDEIWRRGEEAGDWRDKRHINVQAAFGFAARVYLRETAQEAASEARPADSRRCRLRRGCEMLSGPTDLEQSPTRLPLPH